MTLPLPLVAREGWIYIAWALAAALAVSAALGAGWASAVAWAAVLLLVSFFHVGHRDVPATRGAVLCPVDGRVIRVQRVHDGYADRDAVLISVGMNALAACASRSSVDGTVRQVSLSPEGSAVVLDANGGTVTLVHVTHRLARSVLCRVAPGDVLTRGQRYGGRRFGARTDVYLPADAIVGVAPGDKVTATTTILATLPPA